MTRFASIAVVLLVAGALAACAPARQSVGPTVTSWEINETVLVTADGVRLPYRRWAPRGRPKAVIIALHGLNDHSRSFEEAATAWQRDGFTTYAYDQRGFGGAPKRGLWPGADTLVSDLKAMTRLVRQRHPKTPVYLLGSAWAEASCWPRSTIRIWRRSTAQSSWRRRSSAASSFPATSGSPAGSPRIPYHRSI